MQESVKLTPAVGVISLICQPINWLVIDSPRLVDFNGRRRLLTISLPSPASLPVHPFVAAAVSLSCQLAQLVSLSHFVGVARRQDGRITAQE